MRTFLGACLIAVLVAFVMPAQAQPSTDGPILVVAAEKLQGPYRGAVMIAAPFQGGHIGVILNRPSRFTMAEAFPDEDNVKAVKDPIYVGGPVSSQAVFAVVRADTGKHPTSIELMRGVWLEQNARIVDAIIEATPNDARYYAGVVLWRPGELAAELGSGLMTIAPARVELLFLPDTSGLHEQLAPKKGERTARLER